MFKVLFSDPCCLRAEAYFTTDVVKWIPFFSISFKPHNRTHAALLSAENEAQQGCNQISVFDPQLNLAFHWNDSLKNENMENIQLYYEQLTINSVSPRLAVRLDKPRLILRQHFAHAKVRTMYWVIKYMATWVLELELCFTILLQLENCSF